MKEKKWEVLETKALVNLGSSDIVDVLLKNRGLLKDLEKKEFLNPTKPSDLSLKDLGLDKLAIKKTITRIKKAVSLGEEIIIYGDYDADGVCATAILWETLFSLTRKVLPYIPNRFIEGYGINSKSIEKIRAEHPDIKLIITVDNGIVAHEAIMVANNYEIDVIVSDHHAKDKKVPNAFSIVHTNKLSGSGVAFILSREIRRTFTEIGTHFKGENTLELAAIGTIADQLPLTFANRSLAKYGIEELNKTKRLGLKSLFQEASIEKISTYEINYAIAPRINAMGRMEHAIDSLRLICTNNSRKARDLASFLGKTNKERQKVVEDVVTKVEEKATSELLNVPVIISGEFHEGVIGLAAGKLVEKFYVPSIVISKGSEISKASARSIHGFNIINAIRKVENLIEGGGGHEMAAGFSIKTKNIDKFKNAFIKISKKLLTEEILKKRLKVDLEIGFRHINETLVNELKSFNPTGMGNPTPTFITQMVNIVEAKTVGTEGRHLKMYLEKDGYKLNAIGFKLGSFLTTISPKTKIDIAYSVEENVWNGNTSIQLNLRDIRLSK